MATIRRLHRANYQAYLVGGCVRDLLLDRTPKDFDVSTDAHPEQLCRLLPRARIIGRRFPIVHVRTATACTEVTTFRRSPHPKGGKLQFGARGEILRDREYGSSVEEDALRRDFTVNALYYDPLEDGGILLDCLGGMTDLHRRQLRVIGVPTVRYREDPVRMLRAVRFVASLGFKLERRSEEALSRGAQQLSLVRPARLFDEAFKVLSSGHGEHSWPLLQQYRLLERLLPDTQRCLNASPVTEEATQLINAILRDMDQRVHNGQTTSISFLYAALLWPVIRARQAMLAQQGRKMSSAQLVGETMARQHESTHIPRRFALAIEDILRLQWALNAPRSDRSLAQLHAFHAAVHLLALRAASGEPELLERSAWWRQIAKQTPAPPLRRYGRGVHRSGRRGNFRNRAPHSNSGRAQTDDRGRR